jgi:hypothetical protein
MPLQVHVVDVSRLYEVLKSFWERGYRCEADEDGDWECKKPVNELQVDIHLILLKPRPQS